MSLKKADISDLGILYRLGWDFAQASPYKDKADPRRVLDVMYEVLTNSNGVIFLKDDVAFLMGMKIPFLYGNVLQATELAWWVDPKARKTGVGLDLLLEFENWAIKEGCNLITMISIDDAVGTLYEKRGYRLTERTYLKEF